ncbi:MAG TPA: DUF3626 domain-containing protein, partial [Longimicrobiales bacterium]
HPERVSRSGRTVAEGLLAEGVYRNQYETGLSGGSASAYEGGARDAWERRLFGGAYHAAGVHVAERPKYGALFLVDHPDGPCPRFGSCYLALRPEVSARCSFTPLGSQEDAAPERTGTLAALDPVMAALAEHVGAADSPLGMKGLTFEELLVRLGDHVPIPRVGVPPHVPGRALDSFVEAQVHGPIDLQRDVERLVVDASFHGTRVADTLAELAARYDIPLGWHPGFRLAADRLPEEFRGFPARSIGRRVARRGVVDAPALGEGHNDFARDPDSWREQGSPSEVRASFRRVWHVLVLEGSPSPNWADIQGVPAPAPAEPAILRRKPLPRVTDRLRAATRSEYLDFFDARYFEGGEFGQVVGYQDYAECRWILDGWCEMVEDHLEPASVLDVGAAYGFVVERFRTLGRRADGVEPSAFARERAAVPLLEGHLPDALPPLDAPYDTVLCTEVLEHMRPDLVHRSLEMLARHAERYVVCLVQMGGWDEYHEDPSHIHLRPREWWLERVGELAGVRLAPDLVERFDAHPLSRRMHWSGRFLILERTVG